MLQHLEWCIGSDVKVESESAPNEIGVVRTSNIPETEKVSGTFFLVFGPAARPQRHLQAQVAGHAR